MSRSPHPHATGSASGNGSGSGRRPSSSPLPHRHQPHRFELEDPPAVVARRSLALSSQQQQLQQQLPPSNGTASPLPPPLEQQQQQQQQHKAPAASASSSSSAAATAAGNSTSQAGPPFAPSAAPLTLIPTPASSISATGTTTTTTPSTNMMPPALAPAGAGAGPHTSIPMPAASSSAAAAAAHNGHAPPPHNPIAALLIRSMLEGDDDDDADEEEERQRKGGSSGSSSHRKKRRRPPTGAPASSSTTTTSSSPTPLVLGRRQEQPPSVRTGQYQRQQEVKMQRIRSLLLASLSINCLCGFLLAAMTGYVTVVLAWGFFTRDVKAVPATLIPTKDNESSTIYLGWIALFVVGVFLIYIACAGIHAARRVSIAHLLRYFWGGALGIAPLVLVTACAFDFYDISKSFLLHHWDGKALDGLRLAFCSEGAEAGGKCAAPVLVPGGPGFQNITAWCQFYHRGATDCAAIKAAAVEQADLWIRWSLVGAGMLGVFNLLSLLISMYLCVRLISPSVIMTYANDNMAYLLVLPAGCCCGISLYLFSHSGFSPDHTWFAATFMAAAALTVLNSLLTFLGGRLKRKPLMQVSLVSNALVILLLTGLCSAGYIIAGALAHQGSFYTIRRAQDIACTIKLRGCCCCGETDPVPANRCPEWTMNEVIAMIAADFRIASLAALLAILYEFGGVTTSYLVYAHLKRYQCEYI